MHDAFGFSRRWSRRFTQGLVRWTLACALGPAFWAGIGLTGLGAAGCSAPLKLKADGRFELPPAEKSYSTSPKSGGLGEGPAVDQARAWLEAELTKRQERPDPDGALARVAAEALQRVYAGTSPPTARDLEEAALRAGFAGTLLGSLIVGIEHEQARENIRNLVAQLPTNRKVTRYAIVGGRGQDIGLALGSVELELAEFPRAVEPGAVLRLEGEVSETYERASVFITLPSGEVREHPMKDRKIEAKVTLDTPGEHRVEVMGYGATGPVVLSNVPLQVGAPAANEAATAVAEVDPNLTAEQAEARLFELLNQARVKASVAPVEANPELRAVALSHSEDMQKNHFFGHVSPSQGTHEARGRRANLRASKLGECVASDMTPEGAHAALLQSPAHRAAMLDPAFTHVGVGVALRDEASGQRTLLATLFFGRMPPPEEARLSAERVVETLQGLRKQRRLPPLRVDAGLTASARAGVRAIEKEPGLSLDQATFRAAKAAQNELSKPAYRVATERSLCFSLLDLIERRQLEVAAAALSSSAGALGLAVLPLEAVNGPHLNVFVAVEGQPGQPLDCRGRP